MATGSRLSDFKRKTKRPTHAGSPSHRSPRRPAPEVQKPIVKDPFEEDGYINREDSEFKLQYTHLVLENLLTDAEQKRKRNEGMKVKPGIPLSEDFISRLELILKAARERLKGGACERLLNCIKKVKESVHIYKVQAMMQNMMLAENGILEAEDKRRLPKGMETPRTAIHAMTRMKHLDRIQKENETAHYMHPVQLAQAAEGNTRKCATSSMPLPYTRRSNDVVSKRANSSGPVSTMAGEIRSFGRSDFDSKKISAGDTIITEHDETLDKFIKKARKQAQQQMLQRSRSGSSQRRGNRKPPPDPALYLPPFEAPPPVLTGDTGGFFEKHPILPRRCSTAPGRMHTGSPDEEDLESGINQEEFNPMRSRISVKEMARLSKPKPEPWRSLNLLAKKTDSPRKRSRSSTGSDKVSTIYSHRSEIEAIGTTLEARSSIQRSRLSLKPELGKQIRKDTARTPGKFDCKVGSMTKLFLQARGFEEVGDAGEEQLESVVDMLGSSTKTKLALPRHRCIPSTWKLFGAEADKLHIVEQCWTSEVAYARGCLNEGVIPSIVKFFAEPSSKLDFADYLVGDNDMQAFLDALQAPQACKSLRHTRPLVQEINLSGNKRLSDSMISQFLSVIFQDIKSIGMPCVGPVKVLSFAHCVGFGACSFETICAVLNRGVELRQLEELDFQGISVPANMWSKLCDSLRLTRLLRKLSLAQTGCGMRTQRECCAVADFLREGSCKALQSLDVSGNHFLHEGCTALGDALRATPDEFHEFDLSHNAGLSAFSSDMLQFNPIMHVLESLGETTLTKAAFANCQLSFAEDCILEDAVASSDITHLELADNPHGEQGLRCLLRLLVGGRVSGGRLQSLGLSMLRNCPLPADALKYDYVDPSASYSLNLGKPQHRSVLRLLLKRAERQARDFFACFSDVHRDGRYLSEGLQSLCTKRVDRGGDDWQIPREGVLTFKFELPSCFKLQDDLGTFLQNHERKERVRTDFDGFCRLFRLYRTLLDERSRGMLLCAIGRDFALKLCQLQHLMLCDKENMAFVVVTLMPTVNVQTSRTVMFDLIEACRKQSSSALVSQVKEQTKSLLYFNAMHIDGHYRLDLLSFTDRRTAEQCMVISHWVRNHNIALQRLDLSEHGNHECLRHAFWAGHRFSYDSVCWQLPDDGLFEFDAVLPRMPLQAEDITEISVVDQIIQVMLDSPCRFKDRLVVLRLIAHQLVLRPEELHELLFAFPNRSPKFAAAKKFDFSPRVEAYVLLYNRTLYHSQVVSPRILYNPLLFEPGESLEIQQRLGQIHTFDLVNLHSKSSNLGTRHGPLDLVTWDGWVVAKLLIALSHTEHGANFFDCYWSEKAKLFDHGYTFMIPKEWVPNPPRVGELSLTWSSSPDEINFSKRRELAENNLGWAFPPRPWLRRRSILRKAGMMQQITSSVDFHRNVS